MTRGEGQFFSREEPSGWETLALRRGHVMEAELPVSADAAKGDALAAFLVQRVSLNVLGELVVEARSLGAADPELARSMSTHFNRRRGTIHLCGETCGGEGDHALHLTAFTLYDWEDFEPEYLTAHLRRSAQRWLTEELEAVEKPEEELDITGAPTFGITAGEEPNQEGRKSALKRPAAALGEEPPRDPRRAHFERREDEKAGLDRAALRERLARVKARVAGGGTGQADQMEPTPPGGAGQPQAEESFSPGYSPSVLGEALQHGTHLQAPPHHRQAALQDQRAQEGGQEKKDKKKKERKEREATDGLQVAIRDGTTRGLQKQLLERAADAAKRKAREKRAEKKKTKKKDLSSQLAKILMGHGKRSKKKQGKKRSRRKKDPEDPDYPESDGSGSTSSAMRSSEQGSGDSSDEGSSSSGRELDAPLKKRSKEKPGSVLGLLVEHARQQLDQSAKVSLHGSSRDNPTQGIKLSSYFSVILRPQLGQMSAAVRELHLLANGMDMLRQGDLDILGDLLASRFMSVHQSIIDGGWSTARHLELLPLEDNSAAGSAVVLEARKHAKLAARLANQDYWTGSAGGRGRGGRGKGEGWGASQWGASEQKGKGKKGAKGKGKSKQPWQASQGGEGDGLAGKTREKVPDK